MVYVFIHQEILRITPFNIYIGLRFFLRISIVNKEPFVMPVLMSNVLVKISVTSSHHVRVCVGREVENATFWSSQPTSQSSISQELISGWSLYLNSEYVMPGLLYNGGPFEPARNSILLGEHFFLITNHLVNRLSIWLSVNFIINQFLVNQFVNAYCRLWVLIKIFL